jgi:hypothetical protein
VRIAASKDEAGQNSLGDLGSPIQPGTYRYGPDLVDVTPSDIKLAMGNPETVFTAIHPDFYSDEMPYLLTGVEISGL